MIIINLEMLNVIYSVIGNIIFFQRIPCVKPYVYYSVV